MRSRTCRGHVVSLTRMVTSPTKIFDDVRRRVMGRQQDAWAASSLDESTRHFTTALVYHSVVFDFVIVAVYHL